MSESVELATISLADLVGSTRLANAVGPVRADELRKELRAKDTGLIVWIGASRDSAQGNISMGGG